MKPLVSIGGLILLGVLAFVAVRTELSQTALALFSDIETQCERAIAEDLVIAKTSDMEFTEADIDADGIDDRIVRLTGAATCGSGGCIYELCLQNDSGGVEHVSFGFAAHELTVLDTTANGMRDIMVNNDQSLRLRWNGFKYELAL